MLARKALLTREKTRIVYTSYINGLAPVLWYRLRETGGTTVANSGSLAQTGTWAAGGGALGQTGALGANEAYDFDGAAASGSLVSTSAATEVNNAAALTIAALVNLDGAGGSGGVSYFFVDNGFVRALRINSASLPLRAFVANGGTAANTITVNNAVTTGAWQWVFMTYDDAGDRIIRLYRGISGAVAQLATTTETQGTAAASNGSGQINVGNHTGRANALDGRTDEFLFFDKVLSAAQMTQIVALSGV